MNPLQERIRQSLESKGIRLHIREEELRKLPKEQAFLLLGNRLWHGVDEEVVAFKRLGRRLNELQILNPRSFPAVDVYSWSVFWVKSNPSNCLFVLAAPFI